MPTPAPESRPLPASEAAKSMEEAVRDAFPRAELDLIVNNHPGVMTHVCGLFARRAFNVDGILCLPIGDGATSRIWLLVEDGPRLEQLIKQLRKLEDVREVRQEQSGSDGPKTFRRLEEMFMG